MDLLAREVGGEERAWVMDILARKVKRGPVLWIS
jgi:hypothetical protein